jgi:hypothetical protein
MSELKLRPPKTAETANGLPDAKHLLRVRRGGLRPYEFFLWRRPRPMGNVTPSMGAGHGMPCPYEERLAARFAIAREQAMRSPAE